MRELFIRMTPAQRKKYGGLMMEMLKQIVRTRTATKDLVREPFNAEGAIRSTLLAGSNLYL